jgi:hypothetical protein
METKHTPTQSRDFMITYKGDHHIVAFKVDSHRLSDAEDAVQCVLNHGNAHDELVAALYAAPQRGYPEPAEAYASRVVEWFNTIRHNALNKARGEA